MDEEGGFSLGGFLFGNIDESGALDNDDFDKELQEGLGSFVKHAKSFGLDRLGFDGTNDDNDQKDIAEDSVETKADNNSRKDVEFDRQLAGLLFSNGASGQIKFTNLFRSGIIPPLDLEDDENALPLALTKYRLRRYRVRRKKHAKPVNYVDDQVEEFHRKKVWATATLFGQQLSGSNARMSADWIGGISGIPSGQASRYRILSQLRHSVASVRKQSARAKAFESMLRSKADTIIELARVPPVSLNFDDHQFHPVETTEWERGIILDDDDERVKSGKWEDRKLTPKFVEVRALPQVPLKPSIPFSFGSNPLLSLLGSRMASGYSSPRPAPQLLPNILHRPESEATRVINGELESGKWSESILWDDVELPKVLPPTRLILDVNDPFLTLTIESKEGENGGGSGGLSLKDLSRLNKLINKAKAKKGIASGTQTPNATSNQAQAQTQQPQIHKAVNYSKFQTSDKFNLSNDKYYEESTASDANSNAVSKATKQSMVKSQLAARIGLQHAVPAVKLTAPLFNTGWTKEDLRRWHRPTLSEPIEPKLLFSTVSISKKQQQQQTTIASQVIRNAKKLGLRDGSEFVLLEYSEELPLLLMNPGMATFLLHCYRKSNPKEMPPSIEPSFGTLKILEPAESSPFWIFGDVQSGSCLPMIQNNLFRALLFPHASSSNDFLAIRSHMKGKVGTKLYLRPLPSQTILVGQEFPTAQIPGPHSRKQNLFSRGRVQVFAYRLFSKDATASVTGRPRLKIGRILAAFPQFSEGSIRKWLKEYAESVRVGKDSGLWQRKADAPVLSEEDLRGLVTPELVCTHESMLVGQQRLQDSGHLIAGMDEDESKLQDDEAAGAGDDEAAEVQRAPWNVTANLANAILGKSMLQLRNPSDPTGTNFNFVKISTRKPTEADDAQAGMKRSKGGSGTDQASYKAEIAKIWQAQLKSLSDSNPPEAVPETQAEESLELETASIHSGSTSTSKRTQSYGGGRRLVITRALKNEVTGQVEIRSETIHDPFVIQAYLKERRSLDTKAKRKQQLAAANAARAASRPAKEPVSGTASSSNSQGEKKVNVRCGTCGAIGHMRTNRICPMYAEYEREQASMAASVAAGGVKVEGTKISISLSTLASVKPKPKPVKKKPSAALMTMAQQRALSQFSLFIQDVIATLTALPNSWPFRKPVSKKDYPHYFQIISRPIDLGTIRGRAKRQSYRSPDAFLADLRLVHANCLQFNLADHPFTVMAAEVVAEGERMLAQKQQQIDVWMADLQDDSGGAVDVIVAAADGEVEEEASSGLVIDHNHDGLDDADHLDVDS